MASDPTQDIARGAAALLANPADFDTWLGLAGFIAASGKTAPARNAFASLGRAACLGGQVALAAACARWLAAHGAAAESDTVTRLIADCHSAESKKLAAEARPRPPARAGTEQGGTGAATTMDAALAAAMRAILGAGRAAEERAPGSYAPTPLISSLPASDAIALMGAMSAVPYPAGKDVVVVGEPANELYWIARGKAKVRRGDVELAELQPGALFGEIALISGGVRTATVTCATEAWILTVPAAAVETLAARHPALAKVIAEHARARLLGNVLRTSDLFSRLSDGDRAAILPRFETTLIPAGKAFIRAGETNEHLWVVVSGRCEVRHGSDVLAVLGHGDGLGEISLLERKAATADVVALEPTAMLRLSRSNFDEVALEHPELLAEVYRLLVARQQENREIVHDAGELVV